jgi:hypothetical protein
MSQLTSVSIYTHASALASITRMPLDIPPLVMHKAALWKGSLTRLKFLVEA